MNRTPRFIVSTILAAFLVAIVPARVDGREYLVATASPGGTFYPVGVALANLVKIALQDSRGITLTAVATAGSNENVQLLRNGEVQFAILQGLVGLQAWTAEGEFEGSRPNHDIRSLTSLWPNVEQFVIRSEFRDSGTIDDLLAMKGHRVVFGELTSGTMTSSRVLLNNLGSNIDVDYELVHLTYGPAADALRAGDVDAIALPAGLPTKSLSRLKASMGENAVILSFTENQARAADGGRRLWSHFRIPADTYPGQPNFIETIAQPNFLAVRADVDEEDIYLVVKAIFDNLPLLYSLHPAAKAVSLESSMLGLPIPLHAGAARYYRGQGLKVPEHLLIIK